MSLDAQQVNASLDDTDSATRQITASCQGIVQTSVAPSSSPWYAEVARDLGQAQAVARQWLDGLADRFEETILVGVGQCAVAMRGAQQTLTPLFGQAEAGSTQAQSQVVAVLDGLVDQLSALPNAVDDYQAALRSWGQDLARAHDDLNRTIGQIQEQETTLSAQINATNAEIDSLNNEIKKGKKAIKDAESDRNKGIAETVFGIVLAPFTAGISLVLAGVGVSSIAEAETQIDHMEDQIHDAQRRIVDLQHGLTQDQAQIVTLQGLTMPLQMALDDTNTAEASLDVMRADWSAFDQELAGVIDKLRDADTADVWVLQKAWFDAAVDEWAQVEAKAIDLGGVSISQRAISRHVVLAPVVRRVARGQAPTLPAGLKLSAPAGPDTHEPSPTAPVLSLGPLDVWAASFIDNRMSTALLGYTPSKQLAGQRERTGARYIWDIRLSADRRRATFVGQADHTFEVDLDALYAEVS